MLSAVINPPEYAVCKPLPLLFRCILQSVLHPKERRNEEQISHNPGYWVAEADTGPGDSRHEPKLTPQRAIISITPLSIERLLKPSPWIE